ncbi:hypothetical protein M3J09_011360, partial [Ascochyta lentis]
MPLMPMETALRPKGSGYRPQEATCASVASLRLHQPLSILELGDQIWKFGHIFKSSRRRCNAIVVCANSNMIITN